MENLNLGVVEDPRVDAAKEKDYRHCEIASGEKKIKVKWVEKNPEDFRQFPIRNQDGSSSCVAQAIAKVLGINNYFESGDFVELSAKDIYTRRSNEGEGMWGVDALMIAVTHGATLESLIPSQNMDEESMNKIERKIYEEQIGLIFKGKNFVMLPFDIDLIGEQIQKGRGVLMFFRFNLDEWTDCPEIKSDDPKLHHAVVGVDTTMHNGEKAIVIDDSWGEFFGLKGQRVITESFLKERLSFCGYIRDMQNDWMRVEDKEEERKPKYKFIKTLKFSTKFNVDEDVKALQRILIYENLFPVDVDVTGYYGSITRRAVLQFQFKYKIDRDQELYELDGRAVGPKTIKKLNELYNE